MTMVSIPGYRPRQHRDPRWLGSERASLDPCDQPFGVKGGSSRDLHASSFDV